MVGEKGEWMGEGAWEASLELYRWAPLVHVRIGVTLPRAGIAQGWSGGVTRNRNSPSAVGLLDFQWVRASFRDWNFGCVG